MFGSILEQIDPLYVLQTVPIQRGFNKMLNVGDRFFIHILEEVQPRRMKKEGPEERKYLKCILELKRKEEK